MLLVSFLSLAACAADAVRLAPDPYRAVVYLTLLRRRKFWKVFERRAPLHLLKDTDVRRASRASIVSVMMSIAAGPRRTRDRLRWYKAFILWLVSFFLFFRRKGLGFRRRLANIVGVRVTLDGIHG